MTLEEVLHRIATMTPFTRGYILGVFFHSHPDEFERAYLEGTIRED